MKSMPEEVNDKLKYFESPEEYAAKYSEPQIVFYQLGAKMVDSQDAIPDTAKEIMYYTLAVGHHTGVLDLFQEKLACSLDMFNAILKLLEDYTVEHDKLYRVLQFGEILIDRGHAPGLSKAIAHAFENTDDLEIKSWLSEFSDILQAIAYEPAMYVIGKRVS